MEHYRDPGPQRYSDEPITIIVTTTLLKLN